MKDREKDGQGWDQFQARGTGPAEKGRELFPESVSQTNASESSPTSQHTGGSGMPKKDSLLTPAVSSGSSGPLPDQRLPAGWEGSQDPAWPQCPQSSFT